MTCAIAVNNVWLMREQEGLWCGCSCIAITEIWGI